MSQSASPNPLAGIVDIEPPPAPPLSGGDELWLAGGALLLVVLAGYLLWRHWSNPRQQSRRHLARLRRRYLAAHIDARETAFALAAILRQQLSVSHLDPAAFPQQAHWADFLASLSNARYAPHTPSRETLLGLLDEAKHWLDQRA